MWIYKPMSITTALGFCAKLTHTACTHKSVCQKSITTSIFATECYNIANGAIWWSGKFFVNSYHEGGSTRELLPFFVPPPLSKASRRLDFASTTDFSASIAKISERFTNLSAAFVRDASPKLKTRARHPETFTLN